MRALRGLLAVLLVLGLGLAGLWQWRPGMDEYQALAAPPAQGGLTATWFGVTAVLVSDGQSSLFIDPFFSRPPGFLNMLSNQVIAPDEAAIAAALRTAGITSLDAVLVSHSHFDHAMDAGVVARLTGARLIGSPSTLNIGRSDGLAETQLQAMKPGQALDAGSFRISFIESRHAGATGGTPVGDITQPLGTPRRYLDYKLGGAYSILIEHAQGRILHHGSAGYIPGALQALRADTVLLGVALIDDLPQYVQEVVDAAGARRVFPTHWDDFTRPLSAPLTPMPLSVNLPRFFEFMRADRPQVQVQTLTLGQPAALLP